MQDHKKIPALFVWTAVSLIQITTLMAQTDYKNVQEAEGLQVEDTVKNFTAPDQHNKTYDLKEQLNKGLVVLLFYRGHWCPVCNRNLSQLQDSLQLIYDKGASVVAISPEKSEFLKMTAQKTGASFTLLHDENYKISNAFDVAFKPDNQSRDLYNEKLNANLDQAHSDNSERLPIPATFILDQSGKVVWRHFNPNYKERASTQQILKVLDTLN